MCTTFDEYNRPDMKADMISFQMMYVVPVCGGCPKHFPNLVPDRSANIILSISAADMLIRTADD